MERTVSMSKNWRCFANNWLTSRHWNCWCTPACLRSSIWSPRYWSKAAKNDGDADAQRVWDSINDILAWKLQTSTDDAFDLTDAIVSRSVRDHLSPFLFPSPDLPAAREDLYRVFGHLVGAQVKLNRFLSFSIEAFCYDDSICFEVAGTELAIIERDPAAHGAWKRNGERLSRLHVYWLYRAFDEFAASGMATEQIGRPENHERNQFAYIKAIRTKLQLSEVYGLADFVLVDTGLRVDLFQAVLSLELMTAFFINDFLLPYRGIFARRATGGAHWQTLPSAGCGSRIYPMRFTIAFPLHGPTAQRK